MEVEENPHIYRRTRGSNDPVFQTACPTRLAPETFSFSKVDKQPDSGSDSFLTTLPLEILHAELQRRQESVEKPECGSGMQGHYNTGAHVFALFLILGLSTLGSQPLMRR